MRCCPNTARLRKVIGLDRQGEQGSRGAGGERIVLIRAVLGAAPSSSVSAEQLVRDIKNIVSVKFTLTIFF